VLGERLDCEDLVERRCEPILEEAAPPPCQPAARPYRLRVSGAEAMTGGEEHLCVLARGGAVRCFGSNEYGELGDPAAAAGRDPVSPVGLPPVALIRAVRNTTCALTRDGEVWCWGDGVAPRDVPIAEQGPLRIAELDGAIDLAVGDEWVCALRRTGETTCVGRDIERRTVWRAVREGLPADWRPRPFWIGAGLEELRRASPPEVYEQ